jgi:tetratricopeptide (TPR) repeat protein
MDTTGQIGYGPQTNIDGAVHGPILSGNQQGPVIINYNTKPAPFRLPVQKPPRPEKFLGREKELDDLLKDLQPGHSVTICGPGGIGKTALAAEAIWRLAPDNNPPARFPDGIIFHDFYRQPQAALALEAIARAYGEDLRPSLSAAARRALAGRQAMLVLDGTEAADDLDAVLDIAGSCGVLITSHKHSDAPAEWSDLPPLPLVQAIKLLQDWGKGWAADETTSYRVCELLGGLPLAVFLAGRYLAQHNQLAAEYLAWLEETPLEALDMGDLRHQSIPRLMERTLERVSKLGRAALGVTGVLALEPFESKLIQVALSLKPREANRSLGELINYGLLKRSTDYYQVTHALIRTYARERFIIERRALSRLTGYYITFAKKQCSLGLSGYRGLDDHRAHILALQSACFDDSDWSSVRSLTLAMKDYLNLQGHWTERLKILEAGLFAARAGRSRHNEAEFLNSIGITHADLGSVHLAQTYLEDSLHIFRELNDHQGEGRALGNLGLLYYYLGDTNRAISYYKADLVIARNIRDARGESDVLNNIGMAYAKLGDHQQAIENYEQALVIDKKMGNKRGEANILGNLGTLYYYQGDIRQAIEYSNRSLEIFRLIGDLVGEGNCLNSLGNAYNRMGEHRRAIEFHSLHLAISCKIGDLRGEGNALLNMSLALDKVGDRLQATDCAKAALRIYEQIESPHAEKVRKKLAEWMEREEQS